MNIKALYLLLLSFVFISAGTVDNYVQDYERIVNAYKEKKCISFNVLYKSFDTSITTADTTLVGKFQFKGDQFHTRLAGAEGIKNDKYYLAIDHPNKIMFLTNARDVAGNFYPVSNIDTAIKKQKLELSELDMDGGRVKQYTIKYPEKHEAYRGMVLEFDQKTFLIKRFVMKIYPPKNEYKLKTWKYVDDPFIEMVYQNYNFDAIDDNAFSIAKFLTVNNGDNAELKPEYKAYQLVNSISLSKKIK